MTARDLRRLQSAHPQLIQAVTDILAEMDAAGHPMFVVMGARTVQEQQALYAKGRTVPGPNVRPGKPLGDVVTMKDGVKHKSNHQIKADGFGHAVDCAFAGVKDPFSDELPWELFGTKAESRGLTWGGRWKHPHDAPHIELS